MRTLVATALLAYAKADETSLMQDLVTRSSNKLEVESSRREAASKRLLEAAVNMVKNGVTPDVVEFVDDTSAENREALRKILDMHWQQIQDRNDACSRFDSLLETLEGHCDLINSNKARDILASEEHHECRAGEAYACAQSRRCEAQLREAWEVVVAQERIMREKHDSIEDGWCVYSDAHESYGVWHNWQQSTEWLTRTWETTTIWGETRPYPGLTIPGHGDPEMSSPENVWKFRHSSVTWFEEYEEQLPIVKSAWEVYNEKVEECAALETAWEDITPVCDEKQTNLMTSQCETAQAVKTARQEVGDEWDRIKSDVAILTTFVEGDVQARKNEWETLTIVQCLLDHVHSSVIASIETGAPCPTLESDPDSVTQAIEDCHIVERGCLGDEESENEALRTATPLTIEESYGLIGYNIGTGNWVAEIPNLFRSSTHLCIEPCKVPDEPEPIPPPAPPCTPAYIAREQAQFLEAIQATYITDLAANADYSGDALTQPHYGAILSDAGWAGCAPPLVCVDCPETTPAAPCGAHTVPAHVCKWHEEYLSPGQSNGDTFRCLDGTCVAQAGVCNGHSNCADGSDEQECEDGVQAYLAQEFECGAYMQGDFHSDVHYQCGSGMCIEKVGLCNGINNCDDGSDEHGCEGGLQVSVEATSGRTINVVTAVHSEVEVFSDRGYSFDSLGHMTGKTFIKYSNDDKMIDESHVMTKLRTLEPVTVYIVLTDQRNLPWLQGEHYEERSDLDGVSFSGMKWTRHKEWLEENHAANHALSLDDGHDHAEDQFSTQKIYSKTFPAGTISIPGNAGSTHYEGYLSDQLQADARGSFLIFVDKPDQGLPGRSEYIGCFVDDNARDLGNMRGNNVNANTNTFELCRAECGGTTYMALQYGGECFCANSYGNGAQYMQVDNSECGMTNEPCKSNSYSCGGSWRQAIYQIN